ncbi:MAG TPA: trypsin-like serine protease [Phycisphaerales bacterium]|nr:trypsin-like serine protease [Phycisphaerales bacterium]
MGIDWEEYCESVRSIMKKSFLQKLIVLALFSVPFLGGCGQTVAQPQSTASPGITESGQVAENTGSKKPTRTLNSDEQQVIQHFEKLSPSVVFVTNLGVRRVGFSRDITSIPQGTGSGFVWDASGTIITNFHVVRGAQDVEVTLADGSVWKAKPIGFEPEKDLAVIKIDAPADKLSPIPIGTSSDLKVGQSVMAIGNPFGLDHTLTTGIISGLDREIRSPTKHPIQGVIQTDAAINPGNSGGPLLDSNGRLIGMNTAIFSPSGAYAGIGFAVPVDTIGRMVPEILKFGKVTKPGIGVSIASRAVTRRLNIDGVLILSITPGSPAENIGLQPTRRAPHGGVVLGDILIRVDGQKLKDVDDLFRYLDRKEVGDKVTLEYLREQEVKKAEVTLERVN